LRITVSKETHDLFYKKGMRLSKDNIEAVKHFMKIYGLASEFKMYYDFVVE